MNDLFLSCKAEHRRDDVRAAALFGLDFVEVSDDQRTLEVFFLGKAPPKIEKANIVLQGGSRIRDVQVDSLRVNRQADLTLDDYMEVVVNKPGDFSTYTLSVVKLDDHGRPTDQPLDGFDPHYSHIDFTFKAACPSDLDCKPQQVCPPPQRAQPEINYLAKDYASFRQLILDRLALIMPAWQETHVPDLGITLVELLAYVGDYLSYHQDAVATEAYLGTARQRISVRRHAHLVDYAMHEGCNSRAWVTIRTADPNTPPLALDPRQIYFITGFPGAPPAGVLPESVLANVPAGSYEVFEPLLADGTQSIQIYAAHSEIHFYTWGDCECCLAAGATSATLADWWVPAPTPPPPTAGGDTAPAAPISAQPTAPAATQPTPAARASVSDGPPGMVRALHLEAGDVLIFEEVIGPKTGNPVDADRLHRQAVMLTKVTQAVDPLNPYNQPNGQPVLEIEWCSEDALTFPLCISAQAPPHPPDPEMAPCSCMENVSVARGNVILVDNGSSAVESLGTVPTQSTSEGCPTSCDPPDVVTLPGKFQPKLQEQPLTFGQPLPPCGCASALIVQDPRQTLPEIWLTSIPPAPQCAPGATMQTWLPKGDLLGSGPDDLNFVVEMDNDGYAHLRFGSGGLGITPEAGTAFEAHLRLGNGPSGNVGAESIVYLVFRQTVSGLNLAPRNPLPATGGTAPEPIAEVKMFAPYAFRRVLERAITAYDYAALAADNARRLAERSTLMVAALNESAAPAPPPASVAERRLSEEEEPSGPPTLGPEICATPFRKLQGAKGSLRWTGSWYEALVAIDPLGTEQADAELLEEITAYLERYRRMGHDLEVRLANYVPLDLALMVCVKPAYLRGHVEAALLDVFSSHVLPDGTLGFFHPDKLTFGEGIYVSRIVAIAQAVPGVEEIQVTRLERYEIGEPPPGMEAPTEEVPITGVLELGPFEIARMDNDPSFPENGRLTLDVRGGR